MRFVLLHGGALALLLGIAGTSGGCSHPDSRLTLTTVEGPVGRGLSLELHVRRSIANGLSCATNSLHGDDLAPQGGSIDLCQYRDDGLTILERSCDDDGCTIEEGKTPGGFVVRPTREGRVTVRVRAKAQSDGKELSGETTLTVVRVDHAEVSELLESDHNAVALKTPFEQRRFAIDTTLHWKLRPVAADGTALAGLADVSIDGPARLDPCPTSSCDADVVNVTMTGVGTGHLVAHAGDATTSFVLKVVELDAKSRFELRPIAQSALGEPMTTITLDDLESIVSPVHVALVAHAPDDSLAFVGSETVVARPTEDARLIDIAKGPGSPWLTISAATMMTGKLALYAGEQKLADVVVTSSSEVTDAGTTDARTDAR